MLSQQERIKLFQDEVQAIEKKYQFVITGVLQVNPQGIIPRVTLIDQKPDFAGAAGSEQITPAPTNNKPLEKN